MKVQQHFSEKRQLLQTFQSDVMHSRVWDAQWSVGEHNTYTKHFFTAQIWTLIGPVWIPDKVIRRALW